MTLSDLRSRLSAICIAALAAAALTACDDQNAAQQSDTNAPQADQQLGELPQSDARPATAEPTGN